MIQLLWTSESTNKEAKSDNGEAGEDEENGG